MRQRVSAFPTRGPEYAETAAPMKSLLQILFVATTSLACTAHAVPQLRIFDAQTTITITDGDGADTDNAAGALSWAGSIGVWSVTVTSALTKPAAGSADHPFLGLTFSATSSAAGTLTLLFTETDFNTGGADGEPGHGEGNLQMAGFASGSVTHSAYGGGSNIAFTTAPKLGTSGLLGPGLFDQTLTFGTPARAGNFALTQEVIVTHDGPGTSSVNANLSVPDNQASLVLLSIGLIGLSLYNRRNGLVRAVENTP